MFEPKQNPGYQKLLKDATGLVASWTKNEWYESSSEDAQEKGGDAQEEGGNAQEAGGNAK